MEEIAEVRPPAQISRRAGGEGHFANPKLLVQSWYCLGQAGRIERSQVKSSELQTRRLVLYRDQAGQLHALNGRCAHLGANLGHGRVVERGLECAFHGWQYGADGRCCHAPGIKPPPRRKVRAYPVQERWGLIWLFNGPTPLFDLPQVGPAYHVWRLPTQVINCHPHLVIGNGLDTTHFEPLHHMQFSAPPRLTRLDDYRLKLSIRGRPRSTVTRRLTGSLKRDIEASFTTIGASLAWVTVEAPLHFHVLFSGRPTPSGGCLTQTLFFLPGRPGPRWLQALILMASLLHDDHRLLDDIDFKPAFAETDVEIKAFARLVDDLPVW